MLGHLDAVQHLVKRPPPDRGEADFQHQPAEQPLERDEVAVHGGGEGNRNQRTHGERHPQRGGEAHSRRGCPGGKQPSTADGRFRREDGDSLPEIEHRQKLADRGLARAHLGERSGFAQPVGQRQLADLRARGVQQFEERRPPEEIQIAGVRVIDEKGSPVAAAAGPAAVEPIEAAQVDALRGLRALERLQAPGMNHHEDAERQPRPQGPQGRDRRADKSHPRQDAATQRKH